MKAFARTKDDTTLVGTGTLQTTGTRRGMQRAASSENLRGGKEDCKTCVKKSVSEQNLKAGHTLPRVSKPSKRQSRPQSAASIDKNLTLHFPNVSTPKTDRQEGGVDGIMSCSSCSGNPDLSADIGFVGCSMGSAMSTNAELEKQRNAGLNSDLTLQMVMPILKEVMDRNRELVRRQGEIIPDVIVLRILFSNR
jgi:hypothetical protein